jgi:uncharacterized cupredoxin-like copper-binding protein
VPLALSTGHEVGLAVTAVAFIAFALASSFLFPRFRPQYPGGGLPAFIVICFVFFFGMLAAVETFGAEGGTNEAEAGHTETGGQQPTTVQRSTTQQQQTSSAAQQTSTAAKTTTAAAAAQTVQVTETEFRIALAGYKAKGGKFTFVVKNAGKLPHDLSIKGGPKTELIQPGGTAQLTTTLKPGKYHLYCSVPGHEQVGMKIDITLS